MEKRRKILSKTRKSIQSGRVVKRSTRKTSKPDRLGTHTDINGDSFFESLANDKLVCATGSAVDTVSVESLDSSNSLITLLSSRDSIASEVFRKSTSTPNTYHSHSDSLEIMDSTESNVKNMVRSSQNGTFEDAVMTNFREMFIRIGQLEKHVAQLDVHAVELKNELKTSNAKVIPKIKTIDQKDLLVFGLPANSKAALDTFEQNLANANFLDGIGKLLIEIGGDSGRSKGAQVLIPLFTSVIHPSLWSKITWSGRAGKGQAKKVPFKVYANLIRLICKLCHDADQQYSSEQCIEDIKYKILKHAYKLGSEATNTTETTSSLSPSTSTTPTSEIIDIDNDTIET